MTIVRAAGPPRGRLRERGEAKARSARPRGLAVADRELLQWACDRKEATRPPGGAARSVVRGEHTCKYADMRNVCAHSQASHFCFR